MTDPHQYCECVIRLGATHATIRYPATLTREQRRELIRKVQLEFNGEDNGAIVATIREPDSAAPTTAT